MEAVTMELAKREEMGKGAARKGRAAGKIPGILYGHKTEPLSFSVEEHGFVQALAHSPYGRNQVFAVRGVERDVEVLIKDMQVHPLSRKVLHVDLIEVREGDRLRVQVPVRHQGKAAGQSAGGTLQLLLRSVKLLCPPKRIPEAIMIDVTPLGIGEDVTIADLQLPEGSQAVGEGKNIVLTVKPPRVSGKKTEEEDAKKKK